MVHVGDIVQLRGYEGTNRTIMMTTRHFIPYTTESFPMSINGSTNNTAHWINFDVSYNESSHTLTIKPTGEENMGSWDISIFRL